MSTILKYLAKDLVRKYDVSYQDALKIQIERSKKRYRKVRDFERERILTRGLKSYE